MQGGGRKPGERTTTTIFPEEATAEVEGEAEMGAAVSAEVAKSEVATVERTFGGETVAAVAAAVAEMSSTPVHSGSEQPRIGT